MQLYILKFEQFYIFEIQQLMIRMFQIFALLKLAIRDYVKILSKMMCSMGARNVRGFSAAVQTGQLPEVTHLTYEGVFNEIKFDVGLKTQKIVDLHLGYARYQFAKSQTDNGINDYLAVFLKSSRDGADRDERPLNSVICLDISGSMGEGLGQNRKSNQSRLKLSVQAIKMFISKLRPTDSVGLVTFNHSAQTIFQPILKSELNSNIFEQLDKIEVNGGTTIRPGFTRSKQLLMNFVNKNECVNCQNRIIMLTDVGDNSLATEEQFINAASVQNGVNLTVVGISTEFRSQTCQKLKNVKGFNYFCAVNEEDIKKYVFQTFDFGFFPSAYDINISLSSDDLNKIQVFGAPDADLVPSYNNNFKQNMSCLTVSKMKSAFPSELQIHHDKIYTIGGLVLVKLTRKSNIPSFKGQVMLSYSTPSGQFYEQAYELNYQFHPKQQFFSDECLRSAIEGFTFTSEMRSILKSSKNMKKYDIAQQYLPVLDELKHITPESKMKELKNIYKIISEYKKEKPKEKKEGLIHKLKNLF